MLSFKKVRRMAPNLLALDGYVLSYKVVLLELDKCLAFQTSEKAHYQSYPILTSWASLTVAIQVLSDTTFTIKNLQTGDADLGNSYVPAAEKVAADQGFIDSNIYYLFRDHFIVTGPPENPAKINDTFFAGWAVGPHGQAVITGFKKNGQQLYSGAP